MKEFYEDLTSHAKQIENWLWDASWEQSFSNRVEKRGDNLVKGGNMLQLSVHKVMDRVWIVRGNVGAAMKGVSYKSYVSFCAFLQSKVTKYPFKGRVFHDPKLRNTLL